MYVRREDFLALLDYLTRPLQEGGLGWGDSNEGVLRKLREKVKATPPPRMIVYKFCNQCGEKFDMVDQDASPSLAVPAAQLALEIRNLAQYAWTDPKNAEYLFREIGKRARQIIASPASPTAQTEPPYKWRSAILSKDDGKVYVLLSEVYERSPQIDFEQGQSEGR